MKMIKAIKRVDRGMTMTIFKVKMINCQNLCSRRERQSLGDISVVTAWLKELFS